MTDQAGGTNDGQADLAAMAAAHERYRLERDKRLRGEGNDQYLDLGHALTEYMDDPHVAPGFTRDPIEEDIDALVIGGGFSGMLTAARLREAGVENLRVVEQGGDFGGAWYWNRYPGAACDTESLIYLPMLEETGYIPTRKYVNQPEIFAHCQRIAQQFDLYRAAIFQTAVKGARWVEERQRWLVQTNRNDRLWARVMVLAGGLLHKPKLPNLPGIDSFKGYSFHTSRWDYAYTGGSTAGNLDRLADKVVGIVGTGATAVQSLPHLARGAKHLYAFQRTPTSVDARHNRPIDPGFATNLKPGWQRERMINFNDVVNGKAPALDLVDDGWTWPYRHLREIAPEVAADPVKMGEHMALADFRKMEELRARIDGIIADKATAEAMKPWYMRHCKRPCYHDDFLPAFNQPNVTLVDTDGRGITAVTPDGVIANGREYQLDCLIFATGFEFGQEYTRRLGFDVAGRGGRMLSEKLRTGFSSLHGMSVRDFPNMLMISGMQASGTINFPHMLGEQARHAAYIGSEALARNIASFEPSEAAEAAWLAEIMRYENLFIQTYKDCTPSYLSNEGRFAMDAAAARRASFGGGSNEFVAILEAWRASGDLSGLETVGGSVAPDRETAGA